MASSTVFPTITAKKTKRVLILYVPKASGDDGLAQQGAQFFSTQLDSVGGRDSQNPQKADVAMLVKAIPASKLAAEFLTDTGTILIVGHGSAVYDAINNNEFFNFLARFDKDCLQSLVFISCEIDKQHDQKGFEANIINLLVKSLSSSNSTLKVYASKTDVNFSVLKAVNFVWMHSPTTHLVPALATGVVRKNPKAEDVENSMDTFSSN